MRKKKTNAGTIVMIVIAALLVVAIVALVIQYFVEKSNALISNRITTKVKPDTITEIEYGNSKVKIDIDVIEDGIRELGLFVTGEYYFTMLEQYEKTEKWLFITSTGSCAFSYDGVVQAGFDFGEVEVKADDKEKEIVVTLPHSKVTAVDIDFDSFKLISEKDGWFSKITVTDTNQALVELEAKAKNEALNKGLLDDADSNAKKIIKNFVKGVVADDDYTITFEYK